MSFNWIKWDKGLSRKSEVIGIASRLKMSRREVAACLMEVWEWADDNASVTDLSREKRDSGHVFSVTPNVIDELVGVTGMGDAMVKVGWLVDLGTEGIIFPKFDRHNGKSAKQRALDSNRQQSRRNSVTDLSREKRDKSVTREEKIREDKKEENTSAVVKSRFPEFWSAWPDHPRKVNRKGCEKHWNANNLDAISEKIIRSVNAHKNCSDWTKKDGEFIPLPLTWLHQSRWEANTDAQPAGGDDICWEGREITEEEGMQMIREVMGKPDGENE